MVCRRCCWRLDLLRCGVISKARRLARPTRVEHPVPDVADPAAKVFRIGADPGASIDNVATGARPSCDTRPGLRSRPLGLCSGCSSAEPYPPPRPLLIGDRRVFTHPLAPRDRPFLEGLAPPQQARRIRARPTCRKSHQRCSVPTFLYSGNGNAPFRAINPAAASPRLCGSTGRALQRLEHPSQMLILDRQAVTKLRSREHHAAGQVVQHSLLETAWLSVLLLARRALGGSSPDWS